MSAMKRFVLVSILALAPVHTHAQWWDASAGGMGNRMPYVYKRSDVQRASGEIQTAIRNADIQKLERMHEEFLRLEKAGANGRWMMQAFSYGLRHGLRDADGAALAALFARWRQERPASPLRAVVEAKAAFESGWRHRGGGFSSTVSPEGMALFRREIDRAAALLRDANPEARDSPLYYELALGIAGSQARAPDVLDGIYREGAGKFASNHWIAAARINFALPQWGGSFEAVDAIVRDAVARTRATEGTAAYARLYEFVARAMEQKDFFGRTKAEWRLMRHAYEDALALEDDLETAAYYGNFACMAGDRETVRRVVARMGKHADLEVNLRFVSADACLEMARGDR